jgi:hypothetical protein
MVWSAEEDAQEKEGSSQGHLRTQLELSCASIWYQGWGLGFPVGE